MKSLIVIMHAALLPVLAGTAGDAGAATPDAASVESVVQRHVAAANVQARLNQESVEPSQTEIADLDGDGKAEIVLLTVSYGPTFWSNSLAVFTDRGNGYALAAESSDALGSVEKMDIERGLIRVKAKWPGPNDPRCCPSIDKTAYYRWQGNRLLQTSPAAARAAPAAAAPTAQGWQIRPVSGRPPVATVSGPGVVQSMSLLCEKNVPIAAFALKAKPPAGPVVLGLDFAGQRVSLTLTQPSAGGSVWYGDLRPSPLPRLLLVRRGSAVLTINNGLQGQLALDGADAAAKAALSSCYRF